MHNTGDCSPNQTTYPLTPLQSGMVYHGLKSPGNGAYIQQFIGRLRESLDAERFQSVWRKLVVRHEVLRTSVISNDQSELEQWFPLHGPFEFARRDLRNLPPAAQNAALEDFLAKDRDRGFDLAKDALSRFHLFELGVADYQFVWTSHHAVLDGRSRLEILKEAFYLYDAKAPLASLSLEERPSFATYLQGMQTRGAAEARSFWRTSLSGLEKPVPLDFGLNEKDDGAPSSTTGQHSLHLDQELTDRLKSVCAAHGLTLNTMLQGAWALLLNRYTGSEDLVFGAPRACRHGQHPGIEKVIGLLLATVPVRVIYEPEASLGVWLRKLREHWVAMRGNEHLSLIEIHQESSLDSADPLFETMVAFENYGLNEHIRQLGTPFAQRKFELRAATHYPLVLAGYGGEVLLLELTHDRRRFGDLFATQMLRHVGELLRQFAAVPMQAISKFRLMSPEEEACLLGEINPPVEELKGTKSLTRRITEKALEVPESVALDDGARTLSYGEMLDRAGRLTARLRNAGLGEGERVAVSADRSIEMIIGLIAVLSAGGVYVPMDPAEPRERLTGMLRDSEVRVILLGEAQQVAFRADEGDTWILLSYDDVPRWGDAAVVPMPRQAGVRSEEIACVLYTSGSTGRPKGVSLKQASIVSLVLRTNYTSITEKDVVAQASNCCFDAASFEIWGALLNGARLALIPRETLLSAEELEHVLTRCGITMLFLTTSLCHALVRQSPGMFRSLKQLVVGGEVFRPDAAARIMAHGPPQHLTNGYGPTETTTFATWHDITPDHDWETPLPIGRPISRARVYVLDQVLRVLPPGVPGELYIGGEGVADGYHNRPELHAEKFVPSPFEADATLYRTGDWVKLLGDGTLSFLGRRDGQAKIRGHRVEVGEIEAALMRHPAIQEAVVAIDEAPCAAGQKSLTGHVVFRSGNRPDANELKTFLRNLLQEYLIPAHFRVWDQIPLNRNGKVDRSALVPAAGAGFPATSSHLAPRTATEKAIHRLLGQILPVQDFGIEEDFFELGGNSLSAMRLLASVETQFRLKVPPTAFFTRCTTEGLASWIDGKAAPDKVEVSSALASADSEAGWPLSAQQYQLWKHALQHPSKGVWNVSRRLRFHGTLDVDALRKALRALSDRHTALRSTIHGGLDAEPVQRIAPQSEVALPVWDLSTVSDPEQRAALEQNAREEALRPFDMSRGLIRVLLTKLGPLEHVMTLTVHHCICDGASLGIMLEDLALLYSAFAKGETPGLPPPTGQSVMFPDWEKEYLRSREAGIAAEYWRNFLATAPSPVILPWDRSPGVERDLLGRSRTMTLGTELSRGLKECAHQLRASPFALFFAGFAVLVRGMTRRERFVVMTPFSRRVAPWMEKATGMVTNALPVEVDFADKQNFDELVEDTRNRLLRTLDHQLYPAAHIAAMAQNFPEPEDKLRALVQMVFIEVPSMDVRHKFYRLDTRLEPVEHQTIRNEIRILAALSEDPIVLRFDFPPSLFEVSTIDRLMGQFRRLLGLVAENPRRPVTQLLVDALLEPCSPPAAAAKS